VSEVENSFTGPATNVLQVGTVSGGINLGTQERRTIRLLPERTAAYQDRHAELERLSERIRTGGSQLWVITGPAGVGKTAFALTCITENADLFGHALIAVECGGYGEGRGRSTEEVCDLYFALVRQPAPAGSTLAMKVTLLRALLTGKSAVVLLDGVRSASQVLPFLSIPGVLVIITSRTKVNGLAQHKPWILDLGPLPGEAVQDLFIEILGPERTGAERASLVELVRMCAGLPLLATLAVGLLNDRDELTISALVGKMTEQGRMTALESGHDDGMTRPSVVLDVTYRELGQSAARLYRALGTHPVRDFDIGLITALFTGLPEDEGMGQLRGRGIVSASATGRYLMDDLTHEHAGQVADRSPADRTRDRLRVADYYLRTAVAASRALQQRWTLSPLYDEPAPFPTPEFRTIDDPAAVAWFNDNLPAIMACMERAGRVWEGAEPGYRWQMAEATNAYFTRNGRSDERATILEWGEQDAEACGNPDAQARMQAQWGEMLLGQGRLDEAERRFKRSLEAAQQGTEYRGVGSALEWLGITERRRENSQEALEYFDRSRPFLDPTKPRAQALNRMHRADALALRGDVAGAMASYDEAMALFHQMAARDHANEGKVLVGQAEVLTASEPERARTLYEEALVLFETAGRPYQAAKVLEALGDRGDDAAMRKALELYEQLPDPVSADRVRAKIRT
jgi:tetratricopeptide (TPR) repeat protein